MTRDQDNLFDGRVSEGELARILDLIARLPNCRRHRSLTDIEGDFDRWFDGGAYRVLTGYLEFRFSDGAQATVGAFIPALSVTVEMSDGRRVTMQQQPAGAG